MSANAEVLRSPELVGSHAQASPRAARRTEAMAAPVTAAWDPEDFAAEQIRSLVRQVFFSTGPHAVSQVVFCAAEWGPDVAGICEQAGKALALETAASIAVAGTAPRNVQPVQILQQAADRGGPQRMRLRQISRRIGDNLWLVPDDVSLDHEENLLPGSYLHSRLAELRREFEYSIVHTAPAGADSKAALLGHLADGVILVLDAHNTRRATARKIKETLEAAQARLLGTVLRGRTFPVPERIYRRL